MRIFIGDAVGEFVEICFADDYGAGFTQGAYYVGVALGDKIGENFRSGGGADSLRFDIVFNEEWNAVKRAAIAAAGDFALGSLRVGERALRSYGDKCVQFRIEAIDSFENGVQQLDGRDFPAPQ